MPAPKKIFILAGEASGDLHGSNLVKALLSLDPQLEIQGWGGDLMQEASVQVLKHIRELAFMGFAEVVANLPTILGNIKLCKEQILAFAPDAIVYVDYPGHNMRIAKWAKEQGFKNIYYISPQLWAWKANRLTALKRDIQLMISILPFESDWYAQRGWSSLFVGHPLLDAIAHFQPKIDLRADYPIAKLQSILALLPGSRKQEIKTMLPIMLEAVKRLPDGAYFPVVAAAPSQALEFYQAITQKAQLDIPIIRGATYDILSQADIAAVTSGTATLETALFKVPQVVCYKGSAISYAIGKRLVKVDYISLVNLILKRPAVQELIQGALTSNALADGLLALAPLGSKRNRMMADYAELHIALGESGASLRAAKAILLG